MSLIEINDPDDPRLAEYANLRDRDVRVASCAPFDVPEGGLFVAEGELVVHRLIASRYRCRSVMLNRTRLATSQGALSRVPESTPIYLVNDAVIDSVVGFKFHRGILAIGEAGPRRALAEVIAGKRVLLVLEDLVNLDNVGSAFRSAAALAGDAGAVLLTPRCCDPLYRKAVRVSMGHALRIDFTTIEPWPSGLDVLKAAGFAVVALSPRPGAEDIDAAAQRLADRPVALVLGQEGPGLSGEAMAAADTAVRIPIAFGVDSLNVSVTAAIALHRFCRL